MADHLGMRLTGPAVPWPARPGARATEHRRDRQTDRADPRLRDPAGGPAGEGGPLVWADSGDRRQGLVALKLDAQPACSEARQIPSTAVGDILRSYTGQELAVVGDYLRRVTEVGRAEAERLSFRDS